MYIPRYTLQLIRDSSQQADRRQVSAPSTAVDILRTYVGDPDREHLVCLLLDTKNRPVGLHTVAIGSQNASIVRAADVFKAAIVANAMSMILCHNHPSGDPQPSADDIAVTRKLAEAGKLLDITVLDHIILGEAPSFFSMKEQGVAFE